MVDVLSTWFAYPALLGFLPALPALALLMLYAGRQRRQARALLGQAAAIERLEPAARFPRWCQTICVFLGLTLLILGSAGPRWGRMPSPGRQGPERGLVLVLDVSRSMLAEQPSRQDLARRAIGDLAAALTAQGGPRLALVVFAAHAQLAFPLTGDYDHVFDAIRRFDADDLPPSLRPRQGDGSVSGTRIGEALRLALHVLDPKIGGDILLLSDGDDPAGDDELLGGAEEARRHHVPVHVLGIGNPRELATIPWGSGIVEFGGQPVLTRLNEKSLQEIARRTGGTYIPVHTDAPTENVALGKLLPSILAHRDQGLAMTPSEETETETTLPVWQPRYLWFLAPAFFFLALTMLGTGRAKNGKATNRQHKQAIFSPRPALLFLPFLMAIASAAPLPNIDALLRQGIDAYRDGQSTAALHFFEQAEEFTSDPALVAFNKAAALYRLERFEEAALHYLRCLEDHGISPERRSLSLFQMGNAYLQESKGISRPLLEKALDAYRACLLMEETASAVRSDASYNLELARIFWLKTLPNPENPPNTDDQKPKNIRPMNPEGKKKNDAKGDGNGDERRSKDAGDSGKDESSAKSNKAATGPLTVLPDDSELIPLSPRETDAHLADIAQRILQERRHYRRYAVVPLENVKDW